MSVLKLVNGLPIVIQSYDESLYYSSGLAANTSITLPSSGSFLSSTAADLMVIVNDRVVEVTRDFTVVGSTPYTAIEFIYSLPDDSVVRFRQNV